MLDHGNGTNQVNFRPESSLFEIREMESSGRAIFATQHIPQGTTIVSTDKTSIVVILREYRREVCAYCFTYDRGRNLEIRNTPTNYSFCNPNCYEQWKAATGDLGLAAWTAVEAFIRSKGGKGTRAEVNGVSEPTDEDGDVSMGDYPRHPSAYEIHKTWSSVEQRETLIRQDRLGNSSKASRGALHTATEVLVHADSLYFLLSGILLHHKSTSSPALAPKQNMWKAHLSLARDDTPYMSTAQLRRHVYGFLQLLSILPVDLLGSVTQGTCQQTIRHDVHNAFGIRSLDDAGSEFFGWAVWPYASYFNHSCACNVAKDRKERTWSFWTTRDINAGEELNISYLGGDENGLTADERGKRTESIWGFVCGCARCVEEKRLPG